MNLKRCRGLRSSVSLPTIQVQVFETGRFQLLEAVYLDVSTYTDILPINWTIISKPDEIRIKIVDIAAIVGSI